MQIDWRPYIDDGVAEQPWVAAGQEMFGRSIWLHSYHAVEYLPHHLIMRTLGLPQVAVDLTVVTHPRRRRRFVGGMVIDWAGAYAPEVADWLARGTEVTSDAANNDAYLIGFREHYRELLHLDAVAGVMTSGALFKALWFLEN